MTRRAAFGALGRAVRRAANRAPDQIITRRQGIVTAVNAGPPVTVAFKFAATDVDEFEARVFSHAVVAVGDVVWIEIADGDAVVLGTLASDSLGGGGGGGGGAGVTSFNARAGAVTLTKADVTATGLAAADVGAMSATATKVTTFNGRSGVVALTRTDVTNTGLTAANVGAVPQAQPVGGTIGANLNAGTAGAIVIVSDVLAVGTWLLNFSAAIDATVASIIACSAYVSSGAATFLGPNSSKSFLNAGQGGSAAFSVLVVVTDPAAIGISARTSTGTATIRAANPVTGTAGVTGYTATRVA